MLFWYWWKHDEENHGPFVDETSARRDAEVNNCPTAQVAASYSPLPPERLVPPPGMPREAYLSAIKEASAIIDRLERGLTTQLPSTGIRSLLTVLAIAARSYNFNLPAKRKEARRKTACG
jgi:hypothetical protein